MKKLEWFFELVDRASAPARQIERSLGGLERALKALGLAGATTQAKLWSALRGLHAGLMAGAGAIGTAVSRVRAAFSAVFSLPALLTAGAAGMAGRFVLGAITFKENALAALEVVLGTRREAERMLREAVRFAAVTPFTTEQVMRMFQDLALAGFRAREIVPLAAAIGDLAAIRGFDPMVIDRVILAFRQIAAAGVLRGQELRQLSEAGVPLGAVFAQLARAMGVTTERAQKMQEEGLIPARVGIYAILRAIQETVNRGQALGAFMQRQSRTISGLWSTVRSRPFELLLGLDPDRDPGVASLRRFLENLARMLDPETVLGRRIQRRVTATVSRILQSIFGPLADATQGDRAVAAVDRIMARVEEWASWWQQNVPQLVRDLQDLWSGFRLGVSVLASLARAALAAASAVDTLLSSVGIQGASRQLAGFAVLNWLTGGLLLRAGVGLARGAGRVLGPVTGRAIAAAGGVLARGLGPVAGRAIVSAGSRGVLATLGPAGAVAGGALLGAQALSALDRALSERTGVRPVPWWGWLLGPGAALGWHAWQRARQLFGAGPRVQAAPGRTSATVVVNAPVTVNDATDPKRVAAEVRRVLPLALGDALEQLALQSGVVPARVSGRRALAR